MEKDDQELLVRLLDQSITTIAKNASETLDGKHGDKTPVEEVFKSLKGPIEDIVKTTTNEIKK